MYSVLPSFVLGFHGCDESIGERILSGIDRLQISKNPYDWLGHGVYFWENNPQRALEYAKEIQKNPEKSKGKISNPFVIGAIIDLGLCFNLLDAKYLLMLQVSYNFLKQTSEKANFELPVNESIKESSDLLIRSLDCTVLEVMHFLRKKIKEKPFDIVRNVYREGKPIYEGTDICEKNHMQICVRNPNCIKGYFRPLEKT